MSPAERVLDRLEKVRPTGTGRWLARCPAHNDRCPSLSIRELDDGRILLHDFGGCRTIDVLAAVGLEFSDLYPQSGKHRHPGRKRAADARTALQALAREVVVLVIASRELLAGRALAAEDHQRLVVAAERVRSAAALLGLL